MKVESQPPLAAPHSILDDALGLLIGSFVVSLGLFFLSSSNAVTGGTAGLALLASHASVLPFWILFAAINAPFFVFAVARKGWSFALRTGLALALVSTFSTLHPLALHADEINGLYAVPTGNVLCGVGILILFRHSSSLGGFNIIALALQERMGFRAGWTLMILDTLVVVCSLTVITPLDAAVSAIGVVILNLIIALNHVPGRYAGM